MKQCYLDLAERVRRVDPAAADYLLSDEIARIPTGYTQSADLDCVMCWSSSPQGHYYWANIHSRLTLLPPIPDLFDR